MVLDSKCYFKFTWQKGVRKSCNGSKWRLLEITLYLTENLAPFSKIDWEHKGKTLNSNNIFQTRYKRSHTKRMIRRNAPTVSISGVLNIQEVTKDINGEVFTCIVTSPSGEMARRSFDIQVIEAPVLEDLLLGNNLQEGQIVNIYCNVRSGDLPIHFEWLKDGKRIPSSLKVSYIAI